MAARLALPLALLLVLQSPAAAQQQGDAATDKASLLLFAANSSTETSSWLATTEPCGAGWASTLAGWRGVQCDGEGGRGGARAIHAPGGERAPTVGPEG